MMDGNNLYPKGFHPYKQHLDQSGTKLVFPLRRCDAGRVTYYFTDFGISTHFKDDTSERMVVGTLAQDESVPELSETVPYDPFAVDVYTLGNVFKTKVLPVSVFLTRVYKVLTFLD